MKLSLNVADGGFVPKMKKNVNLVNVCKKSGSTIMNGIVQMPRMNIDG